MSHHIVRTDQNIRVLFFHIAPQHHQMAPKTSSSSAKKVVAAAVSELPVAAPGVDVVETESVDAILSSVDGVAVGDGEDAVAGGSALDIALTNAASVYQLQITNYQTTITSAKSGMALTKAVFKDLIRNIKLCNKKARKMNPRNKGPHGLSVQVGISPEMEAFLKVEPGTKMSRPEVGRAISEYCIANGLRGEDPESGKKKDNRILRTDDTLRRLLSQVPDDKKLHYFNLQHYIKHHFVKAVAAAAPSEVVV